MLRSVVLAAGVLLAAGAAIAAVVWPIAWPASLEIGVLGLLIIAGTLFERRYRGRTAGADWQATGERFIDPVSGKLVEVRTDPATGARAYVNVDAP